MKIWELYEKCGKNNLAAKDAKDAKKNTKVYVDEFYFLYDLL